MTSFHMFGFDHAGKSWRAVCRPWRLETISDPLSVPTYWWLVADGLPAIRGPEFKGFEPSGTGKDQLLEECRASIDRANKGKAGEQPPE